MSAIFQPHPLSFIEGSAVVRPTKKTKRSWRSTGWTPLSYPALALYDTPHASTRKVDTDAHVYTDAKDSGAQGEANTKVSNGFGSTTMKINPYFPLHKDVILAAARELLILDGALDRKNLEAIKINCDSGETKDSTKDESQMSVGSASKAVTPEDKTDEMKDRKAERLTLDYSKEQASSHLASTDKIVRSSKVKPGNRKRLADSNEVKTAEKAKSKAQDAHSAPSNETLRKMLHHAPTAESLAEFLLLNCKVDPNNSEMEEGSRNAMVDTQESDFGSEKVDTIVNINRVRKVSDVDAIPTTTICASPTTMSVPRNNTLASPNQSLHTLQMQAPIDTSQNTNSIGAHLAVIAINLNDESADIESSVKQFLCDTYPDYDEHINSNHQSQEPKLDEESIVMDIQPDLPQLLDLSILVESHLRQIAWNMTKKFTRFIGDKALREFLGYKTPVQKKDRILELISDFLFDVSHAMFAWEKTESAMYGNDNLYNEKNAEKKISKALFDARALRKIGGFEPTSLLYHALSNKRLRAKNKSWSSLIKTSEGKKMFSHHRDSFKKMKVGQIRRDKRIKRNHPSMGYHVSEESEKARSRSSSVASMESGDTNASNSSVPSLPDTTSKLCCISPIVPDLLPISITREPGKSWGILLAKEGSMCVVMRVPEKSSYDIQRGDLVVSIRNGRNEYVNTPSCSHVDGFETISPDWFSEAVGIFKRSNTLYLEVRRVSI